MQHRFRRKERNCPASLRGNATKSYRFLASVIPVLAVCLPERPDAAHTDCRADVEVRLAQGQVLVVDQISPQTDERRLAVSMVSPRIQLTRFIAWSKVVWVRIDGREVSREELMHRSVAHPADRVRKRAVRTAFRTSGSFVADARRSGRPRSPGDLRTGACARRSSAWSHAGTSGSLRPGPTQPPWLAPPGSRVNPPPPRRLQVQAWPVSIRGRSDWDALELELVGWDRSGQPVPLRGTLQATLWGMRQRIMPVNGNEILFDTPVRPGPIVSAAFGPALRLGDWTRALEPAEHRSPPPSPSVSSAVARTRQTARVLLPLPRPLPDHNAQLAPFGSLHVRLMIPGAGQLEATDDEVLLKHASPMRMLQTATIGSAFLPTEGTSARRHPAPRPRLPRPAPPRRLFPFAAP